MSLSEIAENQGITRQGGARCDYAGAKPAAGNGRPPGLARRFHRMRDGLSRICDAAVAIEGYNEQQATICEGISEQVSLILRIAQELCEEEESGTSGAPEQTEENREMRGSHGV